MGEAELKQIVKDKKLTGFYANVLHPAARAFEVIERGGVCVDMEKYKLLEADLLAELKQLTTVGIQLMGGRLYAKYMDLSKPGGINLTHPGLLRDLFFSKAGYDLKPLMLTKGGEDGKGPKLPSTALEHLLMFKDHKEAAPFVALMEDFGSTAKTLSTYVYGFQEYIRSDGRLHPSYYLHRGNRDDNEGGTVTGRLSARDPAFQTIPKHTKWGKRIRECFCAPPGYLVLERDYSQGELRVVACIANEANMIAAYLAGMDLHAKTGAAILEISYDEMMVLKKSDKAKYDEARQNAKPANFGYLYGQFPEGFARFAALNYGIVFSVAQAEDIRNKFFGAYPGLVDFHEDSKKRAHDFKKVVSPLGRARNLPLIDSKNYMVMLSAERMAINSPVQSTLADMVCWAAGIEWAMGGYKEAPCFGNVHDASYDYLPEDSWEKHAKRKKDVMENLPFEKVGWHPQLPFPVDCKVGPNMGLLKEVKWTAMAA